MVTLGLLYCAVKKQERSAAMWEFPSANEGSIVNGRTDEAPINEAPVDEENDVGATNTVVSSATSISQRMTAVLQAFSESEEKALRQRQKHKARYKRSRAVAGQAVRYLAVFYLTWLAGTCNRLLQLITGRSFFWLMALHSIFTPLQGFFNLLVYKYPKFDKWRRDRQKRRRGSTQPSSNSAIGLSTAIGAGQGSDVLGCGHTKPGTHLNAEEELAVITNEIQVIAEEIENGGEGEEKRPTMREMLSLSPEGSFRRARRALLEKHFSWQRNDSLRS